MCVCLCVCMYIFLQANQLCSLPLSVHPQVFGHREVFGRFQLQVPDVLFGFTYGLYILWVLAVLTWLLCITETPTIHHSFTPGSQWF